MEITQLHEYVREPTSDGGFRYVLVETALYTSPEQAHDAVATEVREGGYGPALDTPIGTLPYRVWCMNTVESIEVEITAGSVAEGAEPLFTVPDLNGDEPLPPDDIEEEDSTSP